MRAARTSIVRRHHATLTGIRHVDLSLSYAALQGFFLQTALAVEARAASRVRTRGKRLKVKAVPCWWIAWTPTLGPPLLHKTQKSNAGFGFSYRFASCTHPYKHLRLAVFLEYHLKATINPIVTTISPCLS